MADQILPFVYTVGILLLVLPAFLQSNSKLKQFLTNLTIWIVMAVFIRQVSGDVSVLFFNKSKRK